MGGEQENRERRAAEKRKKFNAQRCQQQTRGQGRISLTGEEKMASLSKEHIPTDSIPIRIERLFLILSLVTCNDWADGQSAWLWNDRTNAAGLQTHLALLYSFIR
jgi:hypothetical protein